jgi:hypothetical protein
VDAEKQGRAKVGELDDEALPDNMRKMSKAERKEYIESMGKKRAEIQKKIQKLNKERKAFVAEKRKEMSKSGKDTLDQAMIKSVREQATKKHFKFDD